MHAVPAKACMFHDMLSPLNPPSDHSLLITRTSSVYKRMMGVPSWGVRLQHRLYACMQRSLAAPAVVVSVTHGAEERPPAAAQRHSGGGHHHAAEGRASASASAPASLLEQSGSTGCRWHACMADWVRSPQLVLQGISAVAGAGIGRWRDIAGRTGIRIAVAQSLRSSGGPLADTAAYNA